MNDDATLLREYAGHRSEAAFTELVRRHVDLVYAAALRRTDGNAHLAADVAQQVFTELARRAGQLSGHRSLEAWLHTATRNAAINLMISEKRRRVRETAALAAAADSAPASAAPDWDRVRPWLDAAIDELPEQDRTAVVLRFLGRQSFAAIGAVLRVSEDAARMRTERALDKLRTGLARRGVTSSASALAALVAGQPLVSAPAGLASAVVSQALASATATAVGATIFTLMNAKLAATAVVAAASFFLLGRYAVPTTERPPPAMVVRTPAPDNESLRTISRLQAENAELRSDVDRLTAASKELLDRVAVMPRTAEATVPEASAQRQQAVLNNLRQLGAASDQFTLENGRPPASIEDIVGPTKYIKALKVIDGEDYGQLSFSADQFVLSLSDGSTISYNRSNPAVGQGGGGRSGGPDGSGNLISSLSPERQQAMAIQRRISPAISKAVQAFQAATGSKTNSAEELMPYFENPQDAADFSEVNRLLRAPAAQR